MKITGKIQTLLTVEGVRPWIGFFEKITENRLQISLVVDFSGGIILHGKFFWILVVSL